MPVQIGIGPQAGFDEPIALMMDCHRRVEHFLDVLLRVAQEAPAELPGEHRRALTTARHYFEQAAPHHTADEEASLFPRLRQSDDPQARAVLERVEALEADHRAAKAQHERIDALFDAWLEAGDISQEARRELTDRLRQLRKLYEAHIHLEDDEVFPAALRLLDAAQLQAIGVEMAQRRKP